MRSLRGASRETTEDGLRKIKRKAPSSRLMPIGEKVLYMPLKDSRDRKNNLDPKFECGIWVGIEPH